MIIVERTAGHHSDPCRGPRTVKVLFRSVGTKVEKFMLLLGIAKAAPELLKVDAIASQIASITEEGKEYSSECSDAIESSDVTWLDAYARSLGCSVSTASAESGSARSMEHSLEASSVFLEEVCIPKARTNQSPFLCYENTASTPPTSCDAVVEARTNTMAQRLKYFKRVMSGLMDGRRSAIVPMMAPLERPDYQLSPFPYECPLLQWTKSQSHFADVRTWPECNSVVPCATVR